MKSKGKKTSGLIACLPWCGGQAINLSPDRQRWLACPGLVDKQRALPLPRGGKVKQIV